MKPHFEGRESEHNWLPREKAMIRIRGLLKGQAFSNYPDIFVSNIKSIMEGILKAVGCLGMCD